MTSPPRATAEEEQRRAALAAQLADERRFSDSARAQIALLNRQVEQLRTQMQQVATALDLAERTGRDKDAQIVNLGARLNVALASKVEELQRYRSEFFGRLREVLQNRPGVQVVGDRFVFQSEVLFPVGNADMTGAGVSRDWGDADGSDMTGRAAAGWEIVDGPGIAAGRDEG